jgi:hypothetical protein
MSYPSIEQDIIAQLLPIREELGVLVQALPELPSSWGSVAGQGWVSLQWDSSELVGYSLGEQSAEEIVTYRLDVRVKSLRGSNSLYAVLNKIRTLLWGFIPRMGYRPITVGKFQFVGMAEDYWVATGIFSAYIYGGYSQQFISTEELPVLTNIELEEVQ